MRYRQAKKLLWSNKTPRVKSALARVSSKQRERVAQARSGSAAAHRRRKRVRSNARWFKAWRRSPASAASEERERFRAQFMLPSRPVVELLSLADLERRDAADAEVNPIAAEQLAKATRPVLRGFRNIGLLLAALAFGSIGDPDP